jgi:glycerophosphoryl diester phosphodiesterase
MKRPLVIAHRGASWDATENTLEAFERAIELGADYVEFDVRAAPGGVLVCWHSPVRRRREASMPTLDEVLDTCAGRIGLAVEIKQTAVTGETMRALGARRIDPDKVLILSFRSRALEEARRLRPDFRAVLHLGARRDPKVAKDYWGVGFANWAARPRAIERARARGLATTVYTINDPARMLELAGLGVTGIFTDRPDLALRTLAARPT